MASRFLENASFGLTSGLAALVGPRPDVIYSNTWPVFATAVVTVVARLRKVPVVVSVQDIYPESLLAQGRAGQRSWLFRAMRGIDAFVARSARAIVTISESFASIYREDRGVDAGRVHVIPNWLDSRAVVPDEASSAQFRGRLNLPPDAFLAVFGGNIGVAAGVETLVESMGHLDRADPVRLLVAGDGSQLAACRALGERYGDSRVLFHTPWPEVETSMVLGAADVLVLPTRGSQTLASLPSKLIAYMLAERPIIALALPGSELARAVEQSGCGWVVEPDRPDRVAVILREVADLAEDERRRRGRMARKYALARLTDQACLPAVIEVIEASAV